MLCKPSVVLVPGVFAGASLFFSSCSSLTTEALSVSSVTAAALERLQPGEHVLKNNETCVVRHAKKEDCGAILDMINALAVYEKEPDAVEISVHTLENDGFSANPLFKCFLVETVTGSPIGFALYFNSYSTWQGKCLYLEDLYIDKEYRSKGVGGLLLRMVVAEARRTGCARVSWQALAWNTPATDFYKGIGARLLSEWESYRMELDEMDDFLKSYK